jgi:hypothetical protein
MINRIFKNWKTTTVAVLIILICSVTVYMEKSTWSEVGAFMAVAFGLLFTTDPKSKKNENNSDSI